MREIELKPSRRLGLLLLVMAALGLLALWLAGLPWGVRLLLGIAVTALSVWGWRRGTLPGTLRLAADGRLQFLDRTGAWCDADILDDSFVSTALIVLRYRMADGKRRALTLFPDSADRDDLRRLRVSLRWAHRTRSDTSSPDAG